MPDLTIIYYTANRAPEKFAENVRKQIEKAARGIQIISVSQEPIDFGTNICMGNIGQNTYNVYRQLLIGAKAAKTRFIATAEDDTLYSYEHYHSRLPNHFTFLYNMNRWSFYTWSKPPVFTYKEGRALLSQLICRREDLIASLEERFDRYKSEKEIPVQWFGEPGRYERSMGIRIWALERFHTDKPNIIIPHPSTLSYNQYGTRKRYGKEIVSELPGWGTAEEVMSLYNGSGNGT